MNISWNQVRIALAILGALALAMLLNRYIVTDKKRIERTVQEMAEAAAKGDIDLLFSHVSADYGSRGHVPDAAQVPGGEVPRQLRRRELENPMDDRERFRRAGPRAGEHFGQHETRLSGLVGHLGMGGRIPERGGRRLAGDESSRRCGSSAERSQAGAT